jgi:hypothetical protein
MSYNKEKALSVLYANASLRAQLPHDIAMFFNNPAVTWGTMDIASVQAYLMKKDLLDAMQIALENPAASMDLKLACKKALAIFTAKFDKLHMEDSEVNTKVIGVLDLLIVGGIGTPQNKEDILDLGRVKVYPADDVVPETDIPVLLRTLDADALTKTIQERVSAWTFTVIGQLRSYRDQVVAGNEPQVPTIDDLKNLL